MIIGIDAGISTTKIVGLDHQGNIISPIKTKANDPVSALYGAFGRFLYENGIAIEDVEQVMLTGVGADYIDGDIYGRPTTKCDEFIADALGARHDVEIDRMLVVSMGTGTSIVKYDHGEISHVGGLGLGGGTMTGLSRVMLKTGDVHQIVELAKNGDISNIDLLLGDIAAKPLPTLPLDATASLFGKAKTDAKPEDIALGIIWTVLQTIGSATILASLGSGIRDYVLIGNLCLLPQCKELFPILEKMYEVKFHIPEHPDFSTAIGAALSHTNK